MCTGAYARCLRFVAYDKKDRQPLSTGGVNLFPKLGLAFMWAGCTIPEARGRGIYSALVTERMRYARSHGIQHLGLYAMRDTSGPIVQAQGFEKHGPVYFFEKDPELAPLLSVSVSWTTQTIKTTYLLRFHRYNEYINLTRNDLHIQVTKPIPRPNQRLHQTILKPLTNTQVTKTKNISKSPSIQPAYVNQPTPQINQHSNQPSNHQVTKQTKPPSPKPTFQNNKHPRHQTKLYPKQTAKSPSPNKLAPKSPNFVKLRQTNPILNLRINIQII